MTYTLAKMFEAAGIENFMPAANSIELRHPYTGATLKPRKSQITGLSEALSQPNNRYGLYDDMGTGKSLISYAYAAWHVGAGNRVLVIMPPKLMRQYRSNFYKTLVGFDKVCDIGIWHGTPNQRDSLTGEWYTRLDGPPKIIITSFDMFRDNMLLFKTILEREVIIGDEVKWLSNPENGISEELYRFMGKEGEKAALMMNGTPARSNLRNLYGYIQFITPKTYNSIDHFDRLHVKYNSFLMNMRDRRGRITKRKIRKIEGYKNKEAIFKNLYKQGRRAVLPKTNSCEIIYKEFDLDSKHYSLYKKLVEERLLMFPDDTVLDMTEANSIRHICTRAVLDTSLLQYNKESEVLLTVKEMLEEIDFNETKVLLAAYYQSSVELLLKSLHEYNPVALYGKVSGKTAEANKQKFINDPDCKVMIINYESGGVGLDGLQNVCNVGISVEPTSIPGDFKQTVKRLDRPGQTKPVTFYCLIPDRTIYKRTIADRNKSERHINSVVKATNLRSELLGMED